MTCTQPLTPSERYARAILTAWNRREPGYVQSALAPSSAALPAEELERLELLQDLGQTLLKTNAGGRADSAADHNAALALVRHLARCAR